MKKIFYSIILIGLLVKILIAITAIHPDFRAVNLAAKIIVSDSQYFNFYDYISKLPRNDLIVNLYGDNLFIYPPLAYLFHVPFFTVLQGIYPQTEWQTLIEDIGSLRKLDNTPYLLALLKLPYLFVDIIGLIVLYKFSERKNKLLAVSLWWLNPVVIYSAYGIGQFDIVISVLLLITLLISNKHSLVSAVFLGIASGFKPFPLVLLPFLPGKKLINISLGIFTYLLIILPYLSSPGFRMYALFADQSSKLLFAKLYVSQTQYVSVFILLYVLWLLLHITKKILLPTWCWFMGVLLIFYSVSNFHPQWFTWLMPISVLGIINNKNILRPTLILTILFFILIFSFDPSLHFGLFNSKINPIELLPNFITKDTLISWVRSLFAAASIWIIYNSNKPYLKK